VVSAQGKFELGFFSPGGSGQFYLGIWYKNVSVQCSRQYTWTGLGDNPTFEKLDRVLVSTEWEIMFPLTTIEPRMVIFQTILPWFLIRVLQPTRPTIALSNLRKDG